MTANYYKILGISTDSSEDEIKRAFRKRALQTHPDRSKNNSSESFMLVFEAYQILKNNRLRSDYDKALSDGNFSQLQDYLTKIRSKAKSYANDFSKFKWDFYLFFVLDMLLIHRNLSFAALALILIGSWSIIDGAIHLNTPIIFIGCGLVFFGAVFMTLALLKFKYEWEEDEEIERKYGKT